MTWHPSETGGGRTKAPSVAESRLSADLHTERLALWRPSREDLDELFVIESDPRVWAHYPTLRDTEPSQTLAIINRWLEGWSTHGLDRVGCLR